MGCKLVKSHKYGEGMCPECGLMRALNKSNTLQKHTRFTLYKGMKNWLIPCEGSNKAPINMQEFDQCTSALRDMVPTMWWSLFNESVKKGFTREEALKLVMNYTRATLGKGSNDDS